MNIWTTRNFASIVRRFGAVATLALGLAPVTGSAQVNLTLDFSTPATNVSPGAPFSGNVDFSPTGTVLNATITAGTGIVPQANVSVWDLDANTAQVLLVPLTNTSGQVSVEVEGVSGGSTATVAFVVVFRPYPPSIAPISNRTIPEDTSTNVAFTVGDPDTPLNSLNLTASSSNTNLLGAADLSLSGSGSNRFVLLTPKANINGTSTVTLAVSDGVYTNTRSFTLVVSPVPDPSTITGLVNSSFGDSVGITNVFAGVGIDDVDHNMPLPEQLVATASLANDQIATFANGQITYAVTGLPNQVSSAIAALGVQTIPYRGVPGTINNVGASVRVRGLADNIAVTSTVSLAIEVFNTTPNFSMLLNPTSVVEGLSVQPFFVDFIYDPDIGEDQFTLAIDLVDTNQASLLSISPTNTLTDNIAGLQAEIRNISVQAASGLLTNASVQVAFRFVLTDGYGGQRTETNVFTVVQAKNPPQIAGIPVQTINKTTADSTFIVFPTAFIQDPDQAGVQPVQATLTQSDPVLGTFSTTSFPYMTPAQLSTSLQSVAYTPAPGSIPVGQVAESVLTLTVTDITGLSSTNNSVKVRITSVNLAPQILNVPPPASQPVVIPPAAPLKPFADLGLTNDDTNVVVFTLSMDNVNKGSLTNVGSFTEGSPGVFQMSGTVTSILSSLTNIVYTLNPLYLFPVDDPGGTTFTLSAQDYALMTQVKTLYIQVQAAPRNHLVIREANDGLPGSFLYALTNAGNNDVITFALPSYPATIRLPGAQAMTLIRNVTIKGPGANLLTISGDGNGDTVPDRQLFRVRSRVVMEGVTLARGTAVFGGAIQVESNGFLTLRRCAVVDSVASQYGGAIDVDGGQLTLDGCFIGRNRLNEDTGMSGAGVSVYSDKEIQIVNTTFAGNVQPNPTGDGGGALVVQSRTPSIPMSALVTHCTFVENEDASTRASAALSVDFGTRIRPKNSIFSDFSGRNIDVAGAGEVVSLGGNICDDSTRTLNLQQGQSGDVFLLSHATDQTLTDPLLAPLNLSGDPTPFAEPLAGSPAIDNGESSTNSVDQRGVLRQGVPDSGAVEFNALGRLVINEINFDDDHVNFIEIYVRRDSTPIDLAPYSLFVDGVKVHDFLAGEIVGTNALFVAGSPAPTLVNPGFGYIVAFTNDPIQITSDLNPTPVAGPSVTGAVFDLGPRATIAIGQDGAQEPVAQHSYLGVYLDPASGTNELDTTGNSITLAPQFRGFSLVPHSFVLPGPFGGVDTTLSPTANPLSPGAVSDGTPFGQDNAEPIAMPDIFTVSEDEAATLTVLANDFDGDGNDRLVVVDVSTASDPGTGDAAAALSSLGATLAVGPDALPLKGVRIHYDPRQAADLQALPVGVESIDTFYYEIIDYGSAPVGGYSDAGATTVVAATNHRLTNGVEVAISDAVPTNYNGTFVVTVVDENAFSIEVPFAGAAVSNGHWETVLPRSPSVRDEASVSIHVIGENDPPVAVLDVITNVTERSLVRLMVRPELAGTPLLFPGDPVPAPDMLTQDILSNDDDIDSDDTWASLRVVGVLGSVNEIAGYAGTPGATPVTVTAPAHGLTSGDEILIANYGGHPSYNGYHVVTVVDADSFTIPTFYIDDAPDKGVWVLLNESNRYDALTDVGAVVSLDLRANPEEDHLLYDASVSAFLQGLAEGERYTNRFFYAVEDSHGAIGIGPIDVVVEGVNNTPVPNPDPGALEQLAPLVNGSNTLADVLAGGLDLMYTLPPASEGAGRTDLYALDIGGAIPGTIALNDFFVTDEDSALAIATTNLIVNDTDVDRIDVLTVTAVDAQSREGAALSLGGGTITYNPAISSNLQALAREEMLIDTFNVTVSDGMTGGTVTSLVAVLVIGVNDTPLANADALVTHEDEAIVFDPRTNDVERDINGVEPDDRLSIVAVTNWPNPGQARVDMSITNVAHDATVSELLNQLADWQSFTNVFAYTITDNSFLFAVDDEFYTPMGTTGNVLHVLVNDRDFTDAEGILTIIDAGPALHGGSVTIVTNGQDLIYSPPDGFIGDDYFRYTIQNDRGDIDSGRVMVRSVVAQINGLLHAANDHYAVAAGETAVMNVRANDNMLPLDGSGLTVVALVSSSQPGQPILTNNTFVFVATNGLAPLTFRYEVSGGGTATAQADVTLDVIERRGTLNIQDDAFSVLPGSFDNELPVLANDNLVTESTASLRIKTLVDPASHGTLTTNAAGTRLVYTPDAGFIGIDHASYLATDQIGGTGTGSVSITVGTLEVRSDFYKVAATTNPVPVNLNVLVNDRVMPNPPGSLTIISVNPATPTAIGTLQIGGSGAYLQFVPSNTPGQAEFDYVVQDAGTPARTATGRVTIATSPSGIYANPDLYIVRGGGSDYVLNVLTNDISFPNVNKSYSILSIGTGPDAPNHGGAVSIVDNTLVYTPAADFIGEERFTYVMSDSVTTDIAQVTVSVRRGDLYANDDHFSVYYAIAPGTNVATSFALPVVFNDGILPAMDQVVEISALGAGTNVPNQGGTVQISPDNQSLLYRPALAPTSNYIERFTYEISDGGDRRAFGTVQVRVLNRASNLVAVTQDDAFAVGRNSSNNALPVLVNDFVLPGTASGWSIVSVSPSAQGGVVSISNSTARYTPPADFVGVDTFTYVSSDGFGGTGNALVTVRVGSMPTLPDLFTVLSGSSSNDLDVLANDVLVSSYVNEYTLHSVFGATAGGAVSLSGHNSALYTPAASYTGSYPYTETFLYRVADDASVLVTGQVRVLVHQASNDRDSSTISLLVEGRNDPPETDNPAPPISITDKESVKPFLQVTITEVDEQLMEAIDVTVALDDGAKGSFRNQDGFVQVAPGVYTLTNVTAAQATARVRDLIFEPTENRITVPESEETLFTITVTDNKSAPVVDTNSIVTVYSVNDAPLILGARADQVMYQRVPIHLFSSVSIVEVDDLTLQPLEVTITLDEPTNGVLTNLDAFVLVTSGVYRATNITAAAATANLRDMLFLVQTNPIPADASLVTHFSIAVDDGFAPPVEDDDTSVIAYGAYEGQVRPTNAVWRGSFGLAVDTLSDFAVVGAPNASVNGATSGAAFVYTRLPGGSNTWTEWRHLQPALVETNDRFGRSVAISDDLIAVGAISDSTDGVRMGSVYLFQRNLGGSNNWGELLRIAPTNISTAIEFGYSVDVDGDLLAVGAPNANLSGGAQPSGAVFLFGRNQGGPDAWGEIMRRVPDDAGITNSDFGWSVKVSGDRLAVGAPRADINLSAAIREGAVFCFARDEGGADNWGLVQKIAAVQTNATVEFGWDVALDGNLLAIASPPMTAGSVTGAGVVCIYEWSADSNDWQALSRLDRRADNERRFGHALALKGSRLFVGAPLNNGPQNLGAAYYYRRDPLVSTNWILVDKFKRPAGSSAGLYGSAIGLHTDTGIVGAPSDLSDVNNRGYAYLYRFKQNNPPFLAAPISNLFADVGSPFQFPIPAGTFADPDLDDTVTVSGSFPDGANGLAYLDTSVTGTPVAIGMTPVYLEAVDESGASTSHTFTVIVLDGVLLQGTPRDLWNLDEFGNAVTNPALAASLWGGAADPDGDLLDNDQEYVFGGDPHSPDDRRITLDPAPDDNLFITYFRRTDDPDLTYVLQGSPDLYNWFDLTWTVLEESTVPVDDSVEFVTLKVAVSSPVQVQHYRIVVFP